MAFNLLVDWMIPGWIVVSFKKVLPLVVLWMWLILGVLDTLVCIKVFVSITLYDSLFLWIVWGILKGSNGENYDLGGLVFYFIIMLLTNLDCKGDY